MTKLEKQIEAAAKYKIGRPVVCDLHNYVFDTKTYYKRYIGEVVTLHYHCTFCGDHITAEAEE